MSKAKELQSVTVDQASRPDVTRDARGKMVWRKPGNTLEQDLRLGIANVQGYFLEQYPEFDELFPRDENGLIVDDKREQAARFIEERFYKDRSFPSSMRKNVNTPYFSGSLPHKLRVIFGEWGLTIQERGYREPTSFHISDEFGQRDVTAVWQREGVSLLESFMRGEEPLGVIHPFIVDTIVRGKNEQIHIFQKDGQKYSFRFLTSDQIGELLNDGYKLLGVPHSEDNRSVWFQFYKVKDSSIVAQGDRVGCFYFDPNRGRFEARRIDGIAQQRFLDFIADESHARVETLLPFTANVKEWSSIEFGYVKGKRFGTTLRGENLTVGQTIRLIPRFDQELGYTWMEGYVGDEGAERKIMDRRFMRGHAKLYEWKGSQLQQMADWLVGEIPFDKVRDISTLIDNKSMTLYFTLPDRPKAVFLTFWGSKNVQIGDEVKLVPKSDEIYEWLEVIKGTGEEEQCIRSCLVTRNGEDIVLDSRWAGPTNQRYEDFVTQKIGFDALSPIVVTPSATGSVPLTRNFHLNLLEFANKPITLVPMQSEDGEYQIRIVHEGLMHDKVILVFDFENKKIVFKSQLGRKPQGYWDTERIETIARTLLEQHGRLSMKILSSHSPSLASAVGRLPGSIYGLVDKLQKNDSTEKITNPDAYLDSFVEGGESE